jgi:hypothetical protein
LISTILFICAAVGTCVCGAAGCAVGCYLLEWSIGRLMNSLGLAREVIIFAIARRRGRAGMPAPIFAGDCRDVLRELVDFAEAMGRNPVAHPEVRRARELLAREIPS